MSKLLISVCTVQEAYIALEAGADVIDLKDPNVGALGALPLSTIKEIVLAVNGKATTSATVGELYENISSLLEKVYETAMLGVDIVKLAITTKINTANCYKEIQQFLDNCRDIKGEKIKLIAVIFADTNMAIDEGMLNSLQQAGFYGAMMDTAAKNGKNLLDCQPMENLQRFTQGCNSRLLISGLAGSLQLKHVVSIRRAEASYLGFRGGVCINNDRKLSLDKLKIIDISQLLQNNNVSGSENQ